VFAAGIVMKAVFLGVDALETTAATFRVGVYRTEFFQPICTMTLSYFILYSMLR